MLKAFKISPAIPALIPIEGSNKAEVRPIRTSFGLGVVWKGLKRAQGAPAGVEGSENTRYP